jgi:hypothetical protein
MIGRNREANRGKRKLEDPGLSQYGPGRIVLLDNAGSVAYI